MRQAKQCFFLLWVCLFLISFSTSTLASYASNYPEAIGIVQKGSSGTHVKWVQDMLNHLRLFSSSGWSFWYENISCCH